MRSTPSMTLAVVAGLALLHGTEALAQQVETRRRDTQQVEAYQAARMRYDKAQQAFAERELDKAAKELDACLERMPDFSDAHFLLAKIDYLEKRYPESLGNIERAESTFEASNALYLEVQGDVMRELDQMRDQEDVRLADLRDSLSRATAIDERAVLESRIRETERNRDELQRQIYEPAQTATGMPADYPFFHGNILLRLNRLDDAAAQYRGALKIKPDHADASNNLASLYLSAGHPKVAMDTLDQAEANGASVNAELKRAVTEALQR